MMKIEMLPVPILIRKVENHSDIKKLILDNIDSMGKHSLIEPYNHQSISNTDWHLNSDHKRPYFDIVLPQIEVTIENILNKLQLKDKHNLVLSNFWFQQYEKDDYHGWHYHPESFYNNVYYIELPKNGSKTSFYILGKKYELDVEEGDIISFPGSLLHCSKPNKSEERKTAVIFNTAVNQFFG